MVYIIHGNAMSTCTARVVCSFLAMGLEPEKDFKIDTVDFANIKSAEWIAHQPFGQVPYLEDTEAGLELFESRAMARYVATKLQSPLAPSISNPKAYALFEQGSQVESAQFDGLASTLAWELVFKKWRGIETDDAVVKQKKDALAGKLEGYERILSKQKYIGGDELTLADLSHLPYGSLLCNVGAAPGLVDGSLPNVTRWWKELQALPAWAKTKELGHPDHGKA